MALNIQNFQKIIEKIYVKVQRNIFKRKVIIVKLKNL